ncbi:MAG: creatininase family protein, partial [Synechococcus sp. SupBloom_Metag_053]|nr:creatininase family protein [Synechococcus sp. SupBloom_Metag_053]
MKFNRRIEQLPWPAVQAAAALLGSTLVLPIGAVEQHGPHLPLGTDFLFAEAV